MLVYAVGDPGPDWSVNARFASKAPLVAIPYHVVVSQRGDVVTFDEFGGGPHPVRAESREPKVGGQPRSLDLGSEKL